MKEKEQRVLDPEIRDGMLHLNKLGGCSYSGGANLYICNYRVDNLMVRCFCATSSRKPPDDIRERYREISNFCLSHLDQVSALLPVHYVEKGIRVDCTDDNDEFVETAVFPLVKIPFLQVPSLGRFVTAHHKERKTMEKLCDAWTRMIRELEDAEMAHGDLDLTNVLVEEQGSNLTLKLIDYDNVWIPKLNGRTQTETGHDHFQHPAFLPGNSRSYSKRPYNAEMDRFSALVIYISLKALVFYPHLYKEWGADDMHRLLFSKEDYKKEVQISSSDPSRITQIRHAGIAELTPYLDELLDALHNRCMPRNLFNDDDPLPLLYLWDEAEYQAPQTSQNITSKTTAPITPARHTSPETQVPQIVEPRRTSATLIWVTCTILVILTIILITFWWIHSHQPSSPHNMMPLIDRLRLSMQLSSYGHHIPMSSIIHTKVSS
jgi:hypothetical protein